MCAFGAEYSATYWFQKGNEFNNNKSYELALDCYNKSIELDPRHAPAYFILSRVFRQIRQFDDALKNIENAIKNILVIIQKTMDYQ